MTQPTLPGMEDSGQFPDEVKRNKPLAMRTVQHDLHYDKPQWTGELYDPDFKESDTPRPGMVGHVPGQMVMGARDLADTGKREIGSNFRNPEYLAHSQRDVTAVPSEKADLEIRPHGGMLDKVNSEHGLIPKYGPQFQGEGNDVANLWAQKGESRTIKATTPVSSGQDKLRYDPSSPKRQAWGRQINGPLENREPLEHDMHNNGLPKIIKFNDELHAVDGHHRLYEARNRGMEDIPVHFLDLDKHNAAQPSAPIEHENIHPATATPAAPRGIGSSPQFNKYGQQLWAQSERQVGPPSTAIYRGRSSAARNDDSAVYG